jgi:hypothetical protein
MLDGAVYDLLHLGYGSLATDRCETEVVHHDQREDEHPEQDAGAGEVWHAEVGQLG